MKVMNMKVAGEDRHVEMEPDYMPAADILTSCGNNNKRSSERLGR